MADEEQPKPNFSGKYKHVKAENIDEYLRADGAGFMARKMLTMLNPDLEVKQEGDHFVFLMSSKMFKKETKFTVGEDFEEEQGRSGNIMKCIAHWDGDKLVMKLHPKVDGKGKAATHTRYLEGDELIQEMQIGDVKSVRHFQRQPGPPAAS